MARTKIGANIYGVPIFAEQELSKAEMKMFKGWSDKERGMYKKEFKGGMKSMHEKMSYEMKHIKQQPHAMKDEYTNQVQKKYAKNIKKLSKQVLDRIEQKTKPRGKKVLRTSYGKAQKVQSIVQERGQKVYPWFYKNRNARKRKEKEGQV